MRAYIRKLQSKPEHIRKQILYGTLAVSMAFVGFVWISGISNSFNRQNAAKINEDIKPFALFGQSLSDTYNNISASVGDISSSFKKQVPKEEPKKAEEKQIDLIPVEYQ